MTQQVQQIQGLKDDQHTPTIHIDIDAFSIHPFGPQDLLGYESLAIEIFEILSDNETLKFIPEKRVSSIDEAKNWLNCAILNFHAGRNRAHFITAKKSGTLVGLIDIIPPAVAGEHYELAHYPFFIEFYLKGGAKGKSIMSNLLPPVIRELKLQGMQEIAAVVNRENMAARVFLQKSGFKHLCRFDGLQDLYIG
jgi:L-amino acid N-acyltransferase YncA